ncbi:MAG TPA: MFS transporter [Burkholderiales bacterium]|nr:MFS transporter [Burkholderiales bacterium]HSA70891.1 MFS transporter [Burkholderiales bacterium]
MSAAVLPQHPAPPRPWRELWLITVGHGLTHWYPATFYLLLPLIGAELGLSYSQIGLIMTCKYIASAVANVPGGVLVDTVGRKGLLMGLSLFWIGFPYLLIGFTHSYVMLLACIALVGFGNSLWHPTAIPTLGRRYPERKGLVLSVHGMGGNVGDAVAPVVIGAALTVFTWREVVMLNVVPGLVVAALLFVFLGSMRLSSKKTEEKTQSFGAYLAGLKNLFLSRSLVLLSTGSAFRTMTQSALLTFLPVYLANDMGYSPFWVGACLFALQAAGFAASPVAGHLSDRMGRKHILMTSMAASALVLAAMALSGGSPLFVALVAVLGFFLYATRPVIQAWMLEATPKDMGGSSIGVLFGAQAVGGALGPLLGGMVADRFGLAAAFYFLAATIVVANLFVIGVRTRN